MWILLIFTDRMEWILQASHQKWRVISQDNVAVWNTVVRLRKLRIFNKVELCEEDHLPSNQSDDSHSL